jgi:hypothetical protein
VRLFPLVLSGFFALLASLSVTVGKADASAFALLAIWVIIWNKEVQ